MTKKQLRKIKRILKEALRPSPKGNYYLKMHPQASAEQKFLARALNMAVDINDPDYIEYRRINKLDEFAGQNKQEEQCVK
jgi:hypothetical protein